MWADFCSATDVDAPFDAFGFGGDDTPELRDELALLVRDGPKRATAGRLADYEEAGEVIPAAGDYWIVKNSSDEAVAVIRTTQVDIMPLGDVDEQFAWDEGEGDRTLAWWKQAHLRFFASAGTPADDETVLVLERFEKLWPAD